MFDTCCTHKPIHCGARNRPIWPVLGWWMQVSILQADKSVCLLTMFKQHSTKTKTKNRTVGSAPDGIVKYNFRGRCGMVNYHAVLSLYQQHLRVFGCEKWPPTRPQVSQCRIPGGKGWHEFVLEEAQLLFGQCVTKGVLHWKVIEKWCLIQRSNLIRGLYSCKISKQRLNGSVLFTLLLCAALRHKRGLALKGNWNVILSQRSKLIRGLYACKISKQRLNGSVFFTCLLCAAQKKGLAGN